MNSSSKLESLFFAALARNTVEERAAYLDEACEGDADLRGKLIRMLEAQAAGFLDSPPDELDATVHLPRSEGVGAQIGPYKLLQQIGEGGMGTVFMAEQTQLVERKVALKIIKAGMDTRQVIARFEAERQALALMDHPNIARVLDAGTTDSGRPYFVMELVRGVPITQYCDEKKLSLRARLELVMPVCQAVQHAHQKGIIHRDLKPSNVLVAEYDNQAVPKVIDFGVAKATAQRLTEKTMFTEFGQVIGTVEYMSPEQAKLNQLDIDTRSDVYSLGVLIYELLVGSTPFERKRLQEAAFDEVLRIIRDEEPPKPSTRLSSSATLPSIAANRHTEPTRLSRQLRGELDWIVMKCLEKDRGRRYETASGLARDIERHLQDEPVQACPPSASYRLRKLVSRNKAALAAAALISGSLMLGTAVSVWQALVARRAEALAESRLATETQAREQANAIRELFQEALDAANPDAAKGADYSVRQMLDDISNRLIEQLQDQPAAEAAVRATIGNTYRRLERTDDAAPHLARALQLRQELLGPDHPDVARSYHDQAWNVMQAGDLDRAAELISNALEIYRKLGIRDSGTVQFLAFQEIVLHRQGAYQASEQAGRQALEIIKEVGAPDPEEANILQRLANSARVQGRSAEAEQLARNSIPLQRKLHGDNHPETAFSLNELGVILYDQKRFEDAEPYFREAFAIMSRQFDGVSHVWRDSLGRLVQVLLANGKQGEVKALRGSVAARARQTLDRQPNDTERLMLALSALTLVGENEGVREIASRIVVKAPHDFESWALRGDCFRLLNDYVRMAEDYSQAIKLRPHDHWCWHERAYAHMMLGEHEQAIADHTKAIALKDDDAGQELRRGISYWALGNIEDYVADCRRAIELDDQSPVPDRWVWVDAARRLVIKPLKDTSVPSIAVTLARKTTASLPKEWFAQNTLALALYREGKYAESIETVEESMRLRSGGDGFDWFILAMAQWQIGKKSEARRWHKKAVDWTDRALPEHVELKQLRAESNDLLGVSDPQSSISRPWAPNSFRNLPESFPVPPPNE